MLESCRKPRLRAENAAPPTASPYTVTVTRAHEDVRRAQRLRHEVFAGELGAVLPHGDEGLDIDEFDEWCDHVTVRHEATGDIVGTCRVLLPERAAEFGRCYAESEFDLTSLMPLRERLVETGRSCVRADHRNGTVFALLWGGLARHLERTGHAASWLAGCVSVPLDDDGVSIAAAWELARAGHQAPPSYGVTPIVPWPVHDGERRRDETTAVRAVPGRATAVQGTVPPLLRWYLRMGGWVCGPPAWDADFKVADLFVLLSPDRIDRRYWDFFAAGAD
ncbi:GNAT family N-acetyltransferase [Kitasatospora sp. GP82]|uniref:GNAT family N-acetyltransferase n=1 Tax=Kitasatospora sp. GP82 TaxID=3035089 RepID=UPI002473E96A|nr:GNAT family N-acetyltransferase [Kitasatospora sp. GP82]MDH6129717.1 putative hemolysin [Kitasatospora sp. GP82]